MMCAGEVCGFLLLGFIGTWHVFAASPGWLLGCRVCCVATNSLQDDGRAAVFM
jgi:hypothetical protein